jgi:tRNA modification GTPase
MLHQTDDTIVAISSPAGVSARGVIRLSGPRALAIGEGVFKADQTGLADSSGHRRIRGRLRISSGSVPAEAYVFRAPASYTRQDVVELHVPGSPPLLAMLLDQLVGAGARLAEPGEFTARAFFSGALDLTEVEGVAAAIHARSDAQLRASQHLLHGGLSRRMAECRETLVDLLALVEAEIDFVEESIGFVTTPDALAVMRTAQKSVSGIVASAVAAERIETLPEVVILGPPNAGKSTLFNRLTGMDRAIRSSVAGTTRDLLRAPVSLPGGEVMLCDSAGVESADPSGSLTPLDRLAGAASWRAAQSADLCLIVVDAAREPEATLRGLEAQLAGRAAIAVLNKSDRLAGVPIMHAFPFVLVSAIAGEGVAALVDEMNEILFSQVRGRAGDVMALTARQLQSLAEARDALGRGIELLEGSAHVGDCAELLAIELRDAIQALSLLLGEVTTEDLLGRIFARFCIGK